MFFSLYSPLNLTLCIQTSYLAALLSSVTLGYLQGMRLESGRKRGLSLFPLRHRSCSLFLEKHHKPCNWFENKVLHLTLGRLQQAGSKVLGRHDPFLCRLKCCLRCWWFISQDRRAKQGKVNWLSKARTSNRQCSLKNKVPGCVNPINNSLDFLFTD